MDHESKRLIEKFDADFHTLSSKEGWTKEDIEKMKDLQKLMYYMEVRCAMKEGQDYPGSEYMEKRSYDDRSYRSQPRNPQNGQYMPHSYGMSYGPMRRYYDGPHDNAINELRNAMMMETNPEARAAMENALNYMR